MIHKPATARAGIILPIVLVLIASLSLAISLFAEHMLAEYKVTHCLTSQLVAGSAADSGVDYALAVVQSSSLSRTPVGQASSLSIPTINKQTLPRSSASFAIIKDRLRSDQSLSDRNGLVNESGKLNLNGLPTGTGEILSVRERLMRLPKMSAQIADAIMDWIDADNQSRPVGAEAIWYSSQNAPRLPAQRPLKDLAELLLIRGITPELLYGEDANGNGWLDPNEDDGPASPPMDNGDGVLDRGWSAYLTVVSAESHDRSGQRTKINVNQRDLVKLYDQLLPELGQEATRFVLALRLNGPRQRAVVERESTQNEISDRVKSAPERLKSQLDTRSRNQSAKSNQMMRGGLDLGAQPAFTFNSLVDLIDQEVLSFVDGQQELLKSPWETSQLEAALEQLEKICTTVDGPANLSRINVAHAPLEVLRTIPSLDANKSAAIAARSSRHANAGSIGWLVREGLLTLEQLRQVAPYITAGGDVWSGTSIGWCEGQTTGVARHFVIDTSLNHSGVVSVQDSMALSLNSLKGLVP